MFAKMIATLLKICNRFHDFPQRQKWSLKVEHNLKIRFSKNYERSLNAYNRFRFSTMVTQWKPYYSNTKEVFTEISRASRALILTGGLRRPRRRTRISEWCARPRPRRDREWDRTCPRRIEPCPEKAWMPTLWPTIQKLGLQTPPLLISADPPPLIFPWFFLPLQVVQCRPRCLYGFKVKWLFILNYWWYKTLRFGLVGNVSRVPRQRAIEKKWGQKMEKPNAHHAPSVEGYKVAPFVMFKHGGSKARIRLHPGPRHMSRARSALDPCYRSLARNKVWYNSSTRLQHIFHKFR